MSNEKEKQMSAEANNQNTQTASQESSPGRQLVLGREKLGLTQQQVADRLHLRITSVAAVESDALEEGVSVTFTKGYVRLYAKLVHIDAQPLLDAYDRLHAKEREPAKLQSFSRRVSREAHDHRWNMVSIVVVLLVLGSIVFWWVDREGYFKDSGFTVSEAWDSLVGDEEANVGDNTQLDKEREQANQLLEDAQNALTKQDAGPQIPEEDVVLADDNVENASSVLDEVQSDMDETTNTALDSIEDAEEESSDVQANAQQQVSDVVAALPEKRNSADIVEGVFTDAGYRVNADGTVNVVFTFKKDCWVSVKDGNGDTMAYGVKKQGRIMEVSGVPPVRVILGAPKAVDIEFGGQRVDMSVYPGGESAKFSLPIESE